MLHFDLAKSGNPTALVFHFHNNRLFQKQWLNLVFSLSITCRSSLIAHPSETPMIAGCHLAFPLFPKEQVLRNFRFLNTKSSILCIFSVKATGVDPY